MPLRREHNATTEAGRHGEGTGLGARVGGGVMRRVRTTGGEAPTTGAEHNFNGLHPERIKELRNNGEPPGDGQAEQHVSEEASPFNGSLQALEPPEEAVEDALETMPEDRPPAGLRHHEQPHGTMVDEEPVNGPGNYMPHADVTSGGMHTKTQRGKHSAFYGD